MKLSSVKLFLVNPVQVQREVLRRIDFKGQGLLRAMLHTQFTSHAKGRRVASQATVSPHSLEVTDCGALAALRAAGRIMHHPVAGWSVHT